MAISYQSSASAVATTLTMPAHATGDLIFMAAWRVSSSSLPTIPAGWTQVASLNNGPNLTAVLCYKIAASSSETSGTWSDSTVLVSNVYRGTASTPGASSTNTGTSATIGYPALTANTPATSWFALFSGHTSATNANSVAVTGYTFRATGQGGVPSLDSNGAPGSNPTAQSQVVNASNAWGAFTVEIPLPAVAGNTSQFFGMFR